MRRTYRSKKNAGGGLDAKDMLQTVDEQSSAFSAFYIENIKQTKREMSCIGSSNQYSIASNKVRKRKYVKRIIKEVEPAPRESLSQSVFLTPDKSIRVNKAYDPFDMLLNSSPSWKENNKNNLFDQLQPKRDGKTYTRRQLSKAKIFNNSSADSSSNLDSDKENYNGEECYTTNTSDIRTHKLLVEKEPSNSPKYLDDSIKNIVNNISLLNNINQHRSTSGNIRTSFRFKRNRLTSNIQSPILQKSPLCSTPFKAKYRGGSIFKFSPISVKDQEVSPNYVTVTEDNLDNDDSFIFASDNTNKCNQPSRSEDHPQAPSVPSDCSKCETNDKSLIDKLEVQSNKTILYADNKREDLKTVSDVFSDNKSLCTIEMSSIQTTEVEPFFGFCDNEQEKKLFTDQSLNNPDQSQNFELNETEAEKQDVATSIVAKHSIESVLTDETDNSGSLLLNSNDEEKGSLYDTCSSEQGSLNEEIYTNSIKPIVKIERLNDSLFLKYYEKKKNLDSVHAVSDSCSSDFNRSDSDDDLCEYESDSESLSSNSLTIEDCNMLAVKKAINSCESNEEIISSNEDELDSNNEEDRLISFVTTRRRNEVTHSSIMSILDESNSSTTMNNHDKTVLSNTKINSPKISNEICFCNNSNEVIYANYTLQENKQNNVSVNEKNDTNDKDYTRMPGVKSRTSKGLRENARFNSPEITTGCIHKDILSGDELNVDSFTYDADEQDIRKSITIRKSSKILRSTSRSHSPKVIADCTNENALSHDKLNVTSCTNEQDRRKSITIRKSSKILRDTVRSNSLKMNADCTLEDTLSGNKLNVNLLNYDINDQDIRKSITIRKRSRTLRDTARSNSPEINSDCSLENSLNGGELSVTSNMKNSIVIGKNSKEPKVTSNNPDTTHKLKNRHSSTTKKNTEISQECILASPGSSKNDHDWKPIVLQPGKKWERSLSIYRRMSMITDHFDQSILEDEPMETKGRKYRQSVISTMEMQELSGSQHNESINSRRSTFVFKPNRSTIRILKASIYLS